MSRKARGDVTRRSYSDIWKSSEAGLSCIARITFGMPSAFDESSLANGVGEMGW